MRLWLHDHIVVYFSVTNSSHTIAINYWFSACRKKWLNCHLPDIYHHVRIVILLCTSFKSWFLKHQSWQHCVVLSSTKLFGAVENMLHFSPIIYHPVSFSCKMMRWWVWPQFAHALHNQLWNIEGNLLFVYYHTQNIKHHSKLQVPILDKPSVENSKVSCPSVFTLLLI